MENFFLGIKELSVANVLLVFGASLLSDMLWAFYIRRTNAGKAFSASLFSAAIVISAGLIVVAYVENNWYLLPAAAGAFFGTFVSIKIDHWKRKEEEKQ